MCPSSGAEERNSLHIGEILSSTSAVEGVGAYDIGTWFEGHVFVKHLWFYMRMRAGKMYPDMQHNNSNNNNHCVL